MSAEEQTGASAMEAHNRLQATKKSGQQQELSSKLLTGSSATRPASQFKCVGAIRKAGFLSVKKWILKRRQSIELARKQGWKRYWVCLRGTALLFYSVIDKKEHSTANDTTTDLLSWIRANCGHQHGPSLMTKNSAPDQQPNQTDHLNLAHCYIEKEPRHLIIIEGAIAQPIPEHPKRDFVFCLSTTFGDAYLFQASCQLESDNWISAIHNACAASIARDLTRNKAVKLFETKIRHLELEAEKKLFLRQRLESRLTSMGSMGHIGISLMLSGDTSATLPGVRQSGTSDQPPVADLTISKRATTMRSLLQRLNQQLLTLDAYIEQLHCEVYQLRCYLSSCSAQMLFYQQLTIQDDQTTTTNAREQQLNKRTSSPAFMSMIDLPHPKSLLMHVSKTTKLLLIKLGVFTVSSFHAYIHARQGSAHTILQKIQQQTSNSISAGQSPVLELRLRSHSISDSLLPIAVAQNVEKLEDDTEQLIHMSNLRAVSVRLSKKLFCKLRHLDDNQPLLLSSIVVQQSSDDDDGFSIRSEQHDTSVIIIIELKLHLNSSSMSIIRQLLSILDPNVGELDFLNYYLRFTPTTADNIVSNVADDDQSSIGATDLKKRNSLQYVAKRKEILADWSNFEYLELMEKIIFQIELSKSRFDEEDGSSTPFGISIGALLIVGKYDSLLNVYCNYIEWGSVADKMGLKDDDEFLMINGVPVMDLDMMFIECLIQDEATKLRLVVRSSRTDCPKQAVILDSKTWCPSKDSDHDQGGGAASGNTELIGQDFTQTGGLENHQITTGSKVISDEYLSSLVCPPPPAQSSAFLRTDPSLLMRQKSDISSERQLNGFSSNHSKTEPLIDHHNNNNLLLTSSTTMQTLAPTDPLLRVKAKSQHYLDSSLLVSGDDDNNLPTSIKKFEDDPLAINEDFDLSNYRQISKSGGVSAAENLAKQLLKRTEQLTQLLGRNPVEPWTNDNLDNKVVLVSPTPPSATVNKVVLANGSNNKAIVDPNTIERLRKSILELLETEYAYIRHLETISEHYMNPLAELAYLNIPSLKYLNQIITNLTAFQREFFDKLTRDIDESYGSSGDVSNLAQVAQVVTASLQLNNDDFEELNKVVQRLESFRTIQDFKPLLQSLATTFQNEAEKFKTYAAYCAAYSRLQKLLHPKRTRTDQHSGGSSSTPIVSIPNTLDTFITTSSSGGGLSAKDGARELRSLKPSGTLWANNTLNDNHENFSAQLKQLSDFLGNLDSSSSSASLSLPKSSNSEQSFINNHNPMSVPSKKPSAVKSSGGVSSTFALLTSPPFQKSVHQQNFESYLIKPIQRIVKYPMLLNSITLSAQVCSDDELNGELQNAVKVMESITSYVNDAQRVNDECGPVFEHIERQYLEQASDQSSMSQSTTVKTSGPPISSIMASPHQPPISLSIEQLLYFGPIEWLNVNEFSSKIKKGTQLSQMLFVFNSCVVFICKEQVNVPLSVASGAGGRITKTISGGSLNSNLTTSSQANIRAFNQKQSTTTNTGGEVIRYQTLIPVSEVQVRSAPLTQAVSSKSSVTNHCYQWELFRCSSVNSNSNLLAKSNQRKRASDGKVYLLASPSNESRNAFMRKIRFIIRESVRNMSLPIARSPSTKSLTPKKLSSPSSGTNTNSSCSHSTSLSPVVHNGTSGTQHSHCKVAIKEAANRNDKNNNNNNNYTATTSIKVIN